MHTCDRAPKDATTMLRAYAERLRQDDKDAKDAARYRWLREEEDWDSAIDEAIKGGCMNTPEELEWSARNMDEMHLPNVADTYRAYAECLRELARVTAERDELKRRIVDADVGVVENFHISDTRATLTLRRVGPLSQVSWVPFIGTHVGLLSLTDSERK